MKLYSIAEISTLKGFSLNSVKYWVRKSGVQSNKVDLEGRRFYSRERANIILLNSPLYERQAKEAKCIEMYLNAFNAIEIAKACGLCTMTVSKLVKQFRISGEVTLESKLNFMI